jgi:D-3-phosphoglycerate dehydrogenase
VHPEVAEPNRWAVFINEPLDSTGDTHELLREHGVDLRLGRAVGDRPAEPMAEEEMIEACRDVDAIMGASRDSYTRRLMAACPRLKLVSKYGIGTERIDVTAATELGVLVAHTPVPENYTSVAEHTIMLTLVVLRRVTELDRHARGGEWRGTGTIVETLSGKTVGLVGLGRVGRNVAARLAGWDVTLLATDPYVPASDAAATGAELVPLPELLARADVVSLHTLVTSETRRMINEPALAIMKRGGILINTSRGELIDEAALAAAVHSGHIAGAGLDVLSPEPPQQGNPLLSLGTVLLSPHTAGFSRQALSAIARCGADNVLAVAQGRPPRYLRNPDVLQGPLRAHLSQTTYRAPTT